MMILVALCLNGAGWTEAQENHLPGLFSQKATVLGQHQTIGKLLVVNGNAVVAGQVSEWLAVINGDLVIKSSGTVRGWVFILDGRIRVEGAGFTPSYSLVFPPGSLAIKTFICLTSFCAALALFVAIFLGGLLIRWVSSVAVSDLRRRHIPLARGHLPWLVGACGLAVSGFLLAVFAQLAQEALFYHETDFADQVVIWLVRYFANPALDKLMLAVTYLGSGYVSIFLAMIMLGVLFWRRRKSEGISLVVCLFGGGLLNYLLKHLFERARPDMFKLISETGYSFPSGHAMLSLCFYGMLAYIFGRKLTQHYGRILVLGVTTALIAAIGISRIYVGVHYPSDVLAGYIAGGTWLVFCITMLWLWEERQN